MEAREAVMSLPEEGFDMMVSTSGRVNPSESRPCIASRAKGHMLKWGKEEEEEEEEEEEGWREIWREKKGGGGRRRDKGMEGDNGGRRREGGS